MHPPLLQEASRQDGRTRHTMNQPRASELEIAYPPLLTFALRRFVVDVDPQAVAIRDLKDDPGFSHSSAEISPLETQQEE
jgi:hypothetical protein